MKGFELIVLTENIGLQSVSVKMQIFVTGLFFQSSPIYGTENFSCKRTQTFDTDC